MRRLLLLRPEPGLTASARRARELGLDPLTCPLFRIEPLDWTPPDPADYDGLLITSANSVREAGPGLKALGALPVHAVGEATAAVARAAGLGVVTVGPGDILSLLPLIPADTRLLHLAGEDHRQVEDPRIDRRIVYRAAKVADPKLPPLHSLVIAVHSPRAGRRLAELAGNRGGASIAAISAAAAGECGSGWASVDVADEPNDKSLLALAASLCHTVSRQ